MKKITSVAIMLLTAFIFALSAHAEEGIHTVSFKDKIALLHDLDDTLTEDEEAELLQTIMETAEMSGVNVAIVITNDIGADKSDYGVMDFADVYYEDYCGKDTDGILLLINNDTKYDWISTSGTCIDTFYNHIDPMFDVMWHYLDKGDFKGAIEMFCQDVYFYTTQVDEYDYEYSYEYEAEGADFFPFLLTGIFFSIIALTIFTAVVNSSYRLKNRNAAEYVLKDSLDFSVCTDTFIRTYTTRTRISSSSSSSGRSRSRSSGSRSHRSSGGGRHGGGGRRR